MLGKNDKERLEKAVQSADLFVQDLQDLAKAENVLLANIAEELLKQSTVMEQRLCRINHVTHVE
ncbi:hypothetical protein RIE95_07770 [Acidithiobacillus thiooxidans]|uniref:hypothetical protein n=1 Tax=Acidithiobacillus thiooxidans TaxID=930 RepID=UPI002864A8B2|nr:hypothetical protein [Acidithiobacillus thiooxidans]MDR7926877.1 hypothetical protein [Acidithiobacillus thiooxidans]